METKPNVAAETPTASEIDNQSSAELPAPGGARGPRRPMCTMVFSVKGVMAGCATSYMMTGSLPATVVVGATGLTALGMWLLTRR